MFPMQSARVGYVVKRYPRYSETFIVNEILAHEAAGLSVSIFSLRPPCDSHFQDKIAFVRAPVQYFTIDSAKSLAFWEALRRAANSLPRVWDELPSALDEDVIVVQQALLIAAAVCEQGISHLHAHFATESTSVARLAARFAGISYSFTAHAKDIYHENTSQDNLRRKLVDAHAVVTVSEFNLRYLREMFGQAASRVQRVYNGLNLAEFLYSPPDQRPPTIIAVGRLVEKKGFADLIEASKLLVDQGINFRCRIVGAGELQQELEQLIRARGLVPHVELLGPRPQSEVFQLMHESAVFAAPCVVGTDGNRDGLPTVLLEAMALGTPCISTAVTGIPEVVQDEKTGLIVPQHDPASLARAIRRLLDDVPLRLQLATNARQYIEDHFDIRRNAAHIRNIFRTAVDKEECCCEPSSIQPSHTDLCTVQTLQESV